MQELTRLALDARKLDARKLDARKFVRLVSTCYAFVSVLRKTSRADCLLSARIGFLAPAGDEGRDTVGASAGWNRQANIAGSTARIGCEVSGAVMPPAAGTHRRAALLCAAQ
jgi:hypothetical protein